MSTEIVAILEKMQAISLDEMESIRLMDRIDSKFVAPVSLLPILLEEMIPYFRVQIINDKRIAPYCTQYFDTPRLDMFVMHQNGKLNRQKIRIRSYIDSNLSFLEVKNKNNRGRTSKVRVPIQQSHLNSINELDDEKQFLEKNSIFDSDNLVPVLGNNFKRITLVNNRKTERITIDVDLSFTNYKTEKEKSLDKLMILELKQDGWKHSDFRDILNRMRIKKISFSKYCIGTFLTNPKINTINPEIKYNRFKRKITRINKLIQ
ncbi:VTC domain-containing protein [Bacteroidia bacterium]|nr:VTC domain-containing protein [Bacteroidia bacterium]GHV09312.1 VTC domain-containing protein [Bacteroidia bacterium]